MNLSRSRLLRFLLAARIVTTAGVGLCCLTGFARADEAASVRVFPKGNETSQPVDAYFTGLSFEMQAVLAGPDGGHFFSPTNQALIATFRNLDVHSLRVGGNTADRPSLPMPSLEDVDNLFGFARAAEVKVIFTLRLREGDAQADARLARYLTEHYADRLDCLAIGNEPNVFNRQFTNYFSAWQSFAAIIEPAVRGSRLRFSGPGCSPGHEIWAAQFADHTADDPRVGLLTQHDYPGGDAERVKDPAAGRDKILSPAIDEHYAKFASHFMPTVQARHRSLRLEEANSYYDGGALDVSDAAAAALWALDYQWWWAAHGGTGVNFHTGDHVAARDENKPCRYAAFWSSPTGYQPHPLALALKLFRLADPREILPVQLVKNDTLNLTAYAGRDADRHVSFTIINREHGTNAQAAVVALDPGFRPTQTQQIALILPGGDVTAKSGLKLGGSELGINAAWSGAWQSGSVTGHQCKVAVPPASAVLVRFTP